MNEFIFGFSTGLSLILAIGAQNLFVIEQGIKKNNIFLVTSICICLLYTSPSPRD